MLLPVRKILWSPTDSEGNKGPVYEIGGKKLDFLVKLVLLSILVPASFSVAGLVFSPARIIFLVLVPYFMLNLIRGAYGPLLFVDYLIFFHILWLSLSIGFNNPEIAITFVGSNSLLLLGGYLTARAKIRTPDDFVAFIRFFVMVIIITVPFALVENVTYEAVIARFIESLPVFNSFPDNHDAPRFGLDRAQVIFAHAIHYGLFCTLGLSFIYIGMKPFYGILHRLFLMSLTLIGLISGLSSGPLLSGITQFFMIGWITVFGRVKYVWYITTAVGIFAFIVIEIASNRPAILAIVSRLTFSSYTTYLRATLFEYGFAQVKRTPILGNGFNEWPRPVWLSASIDNYWLYLALINGVPAFASLLIFVFWGLKKTSALNLEPDSPVFLLRRAWCYTVVSIALTISTVAIWGEIVALIYFILGSGIWMHYFDESKLKRASTSSSEVEVSDPDSEGDAGNSKARRRSKNRRARPGFRREKPSTAKRKTLERS